MIQIKRTNSDNTDFNTLVALLDADLKIRDGEDHAFYAQFNKTATLNEVVVAYTDGVATAIGAIRKYDPQTAEVKRMFVLPEQRGKGIAQMVLKALEQWAAESGYAACILETGIKQPEAIRLYEKAGYERIPNYGQYQTDANSVCMKKELR
jgi:putative acetyltransferase